MTCGRSSASEPDRRSTRSCRIARAKSGSIERPTDLPVWDALLRPAVCCRPGCRPAGPVVLTYLSAGRNRSADQVSSMETWRTGYTP
jgi:hypothetical protein